jgi:hypothetical protein
MRFCLTILALISWPALFSQPSVSVVTQHNNTNRTGWNNNETILTHTNVSSNQFGLTGSLNVDDQVYAQPLIVHNTSIGNYTGSVLYIATVNNSVYAFNADDVSEGAPLWQINLNPGGQKAPDIFDLTDPQYGAPCGGNYRDFSGRFGIVGTPVIDTVTKTLYVATKTIDNNGIFYAYINALDMNTGLHKPGSPHLMEAEVTGTGDGSVNGKVKYLAKFQNQRPALLLYNNTVYVASASYCDWGPYHGWILGFDAASLNLKYSYNATPNGWAAGIWMAGQGISTGGDGNLYVATGNGTTSPDNNNLTGGRSESLIKLSPELIMLDWFTPSNYDYLDQVDLDYGSDGVLMIPNSSLTISGSKEGISYVIDYNKMGRYSPVNALVNDTLEFNPQRQGYVHVHGSPVYAKLATGEFVYAWAETFKIRQFTLDRNTGIFSNNFKQGNRNLDNGMPGAMLSISSNQQDTSTAIVWACFPTTGNANNQVRPGSVAAYRANDVSTGELWNSGITKNDALGNFAKFNSPTIANGKLFVPTFSNVIKIYGLACNAALTPAQYGDGAGLKAEYFSNAPAANEFPAIATTTKLDNTVNFNWGNGSPAPGIQNDVFKIRWTGKLKPLTDDNYTIYVTASDGVKLWINNNLLIDSWNDKLITTHTTSVNLQKNIDYDIKLEYYSNTNAATCILQWSTPIICKQNIPASQLFPSTASCSSDGKGLNAEYFSNVQPGAVFPAAATVTKKEPTINFDWGNGSPAGISNDLFKARFTGYVQSLDAGTYTFYVTADDGIRLWVNDQLLIDKWIDQATTEYTATINFLACTKYTIRLEFYENGGDAVCKLEWSGPATARQAVPASQLFTEPDITNKNIFSVYPNPTPDNINIFLKNNWQPGNRIVIYNVLGQQVSQNVISSAVSGSIITIPVRGLAAGLYIVRFISGGAMYHAKFIKR